MTVAEILSTWARDIVLNTVIASKVIPRGLRGHLLGAAGIEVGAGARVSASCFFGSRRVHIGEGAFVNYGCFFDGGSEIVIGRGVALGYEVMFVNSSHETGSRAKRAGTSTAAPITIEDGAWVGARAVVLPGVRVGAGTVIAAGAVVTSDCLPNSLYAGVPARWVKDF